jgi:hypothetical protein
VSKALIGWNVVVHLLRLAFLKPEHSRGAIEVEPYTDDQVWRMLLDKLKYLSEDPVGKGKIEF